MAYLAARDIQYGNPVGAFLGARDNAMKNALVQRQQANAEEQQAFQNQNALFQQDRQRAADQAAANQRASEAEQGERQQLFTYFSHLSRLKDNPGQFSATAQRMLQDPLFQKHGIEAADLTPEQIDEVLPLFAAQAGQAPAARFEEVSGPRGAVINRNIDTGEMKQIVGPDNTETPNYGNGGRARLLTPDEAKAAGFQDGTVVQELPDGRYAVVSKPPDTRGGGGGGLPVGALRLVDEAKQAIGSSNQSVELIDRAIATIKSGKVNLGIFNNAVARGRNLTGASSPASRAFTDINQTLEKLRNNYLLLAKGVQTEGDAQRAWNSEIGESVQNDNKLAVQQLTKAKGLIEHMVAMQNDRIDTVYANYGTERPQGESAPVQVRTPAEAAKLPSGTRFVTPDGQVRVKR